MLPLLLSVWVFSASSQTERRVLSITTGKTSTLIFPFPIQSADRGSRDVLIRKASGTDNVLSVKAARAHFPESNLTVITSEGTVHEFCVRFASNPTEMVTDLSGTHAGAVVSFENTDLNMRQLTEICERVALESKNRFHVAARNAGAHAVMEDVLYADGVLFFRIRIRNASVIPFDIGRLRFSLQDRKQVRRTATGQEDLHSLLNYGTENSIQGKAEKVLVAALPRFTLSPKKILSIAIEEKNGSRHLSLTVSGRKLARARAIDNRR